MIKDYENLIILLRKLKALNRLNEFSLIKFVGFEYKDEKIIKTLDSDSCESIFKRFLKEANESKFITKREFESYMGLFNSPFVIPLNRK